MQFVLQRNGLAVVLDYPFDQPFFDDMVEQARWHRCRRLTRQLN